MTALLLAAYYGYADVVKLLLEARASIEAKNIVSKRIFILMKSSYPKYHNNKIEE